MPPFPRFLITGPIEGLFALIIGYAIARFQTRKGRSERQRIGPFRMTAVAVLIFAVGVVYACLTTIVIMVIREKHGLPFPEISPATFDRSSNLLGFAPLVIESLASLIISISAWRLNFALGEWAPPQGPLTLWATGAVLFAPLGILNTPLPDPLAWALLGAIAGFALGLAFHRDFAPQEAPD